MTYIQLFCKVWATRKWAKLNILMWSFLDTDRLVVFFMIFRGKIKEKLNFLCHKLPEFIHKFMNVEGPLHLSKTVGVQNCSI